MTICYVFYFHYCIHVDNKTVRTCNQVDVFIHAFIHSSHCLRAERSRWRLCLVVQRQTTEGTGAPLCVFVFECELNQKVCGKAQAFLHLLCKALGCRRGLSRAFIGALWQSACSPAHLSCYSWNALLYHLLSHPFVTPVCVVQELWVSPW